MKKNILNLFFLLLCITSYSQINFEKGYFITNSGDKKECLIKNKDWKNNPDFIEYKFSQEDEAKTIKIDEIKEFSIENQSKYIRKNIDMDRLAGNDVLINGDRTSEIKNETIFLKCLIQGKANFYIYTDANFFAYFFDVNGSKTEQLIFKKSFTDRGVQFFNQYKQQIQNALQCETITKNDINKLVFKLESLYNIFLKYNMCSNPDEMVNYTAKKKKDFFNLRIRPGVVFQNAKFYSTSDVTSEVNFDNRATLTIGAEMEFIMPFNNNKWAVIVEPAFQSYKSEASGFTKVSSIDYKTIDLAAGMRHYFYLSDKSRIFVNVNFYTTFSFDSRLYNGSYEQDFEIFPTSNFGIGLGYSYKSKYSVEFRYATKKDLIKHYTNWNADYQFSSIMLGYKLF